MKFSYEDAMHSALLQAKLAKDLGEVPVGAVVLHENKIIAARHNEREATKNPIAHAEMLALQDAAIVLGRWRLNDCAMIVTLEPCVMCAGALVNARVGILVFATPDLKGGASGSLYNICNDPRLNHDIHIRHGVRQNEANELMKGFFLSRRIQL
jgi:tRNA(adenine34) deaminase